MTTIALVDDHPVVRQGFKSLLEAQPDLSVVAEVGRGLEAVSVIERLQPNLVLLDLSLPDLAGLHVLRRVRQCAPATRVLVVSMHASEAYVLEAFRHGAAGYLLKSADRIELVRAVRETVAGRRYLSPPLSEHGLSDYASRVTDLLDLYDTLTPREREVLALAADSLNNTQIGDRLEISPRTVETHRASLMRKLGLRTQTDLVRFALKRGILPDE